MINTLWDFLLYKVLPLAFIFIFSIVLFWPRKDKTSITFSAREIGVIQQTGSTVYQFTTKRDNGDGWVDCYVYKESISCVNRPEGIHE